MAIPQSVPLGHMGIDFGTGYSPVGIPELEMGYLMKFFIALDWRSFQSNAEFQKAFRPFAEALLDEIEIPEEERILPRLTTAAEEMKHCLLLKY